MIPKFCWRHCWLRLRSGCRDDDDVDDQHYDGDCGGGCDDCNHCDYNYVDDNDGDGDDNQYDMHDEW